MKKYIVLALISTLISTLSVVAAEKSENGRRPQLTEEQKAIVAKYDTNKDRKLDTEERLKITLEDAAKLSHRGPHHGDKKKKKEKK
jgi:hypothetical protein